MDAAKKNAGCRIALYPRQIKTAAPLREAFAAGTACAEIRHNPNQH
ncbi:hypothetical protein HMPREF3293_01629 [Christensenella minuta]|uniref:Uncharacterized protein n=1 Tax=Christensenella minuta TaxID=626937 RepID=A0A136Q446_9FIRM|nr:hypothetical protein HMPREF3293_01629 [Christensenella minuta]